MLLVCISKDIITCQLLYTLRGSSGSSNSSSSGGNGSSSTNSKSSVKSSSSLLHVVCYGQSSGYMKLFPTWCLKW